MHGLSVDCCILMHGVIQHQCAAGYNQAMHNVAGFQYAHAKKSDLS